MNENQRIELSDTMPSAIMKIAEGNPGAVTAIMKMTEESAKIDPQSAWKEWGPIISLDANGIYGSQVWMFWKDVCNQNTVNAEALFRSVQLGLMSHRDLMNAVRDGKRDFDFQALISAVQAKLPRFAVAVPA